MLRIRAPRVEAVDITPSTVRLRDVIEIGGRQCEVVDLRERLDGSKVLILSSGELLVMHLGSRFAAVRNTVVVAVRNIGGR